MNNKHIYIAALAALSLAACKPNLDTDAPSNGGLDFTRYVAVGNSLTAGFADGTLYRTGQENSYPVILANQFRLVGGGEFKVPYLSASSDMGYPNPRLVLGAAPSCLGTTSLGPVQEDTAGFAASTAANAVSIAAQGPFNNTGVPGIRAIDYIFALYPALNPYSARFFKTLNAPPTAEINRLDATFFTAWIGNNDVLGYATSGGQGKGSGGTVIDQNSISDESIFQVAVDSVLNRMTVHSAKGAVINIPDVTAIPYFTTVPALGLELSAAQASALNAGYAGTGIAFSQGKNYWVIEDQNVPVIKRRQIVSGEYILLTVPQDSLRCAGWGSSKPIPARYVLDATEVANVRTATTTFNSILQSAAAARGLAYVDINAYLKTIQTGIKFNGVDLNTVFVSGSAFSLDGIHLTPKGYALVANEIIRTINSYYKASVPMADINKYPGVRFP